MVCQTVRTADVPALEIEDAGNATLATGRGVHDWGCRACVTRVLGDGTSRAREGRGQLRLACASFPAKQRSWNSNSTTESKRVIKMRVPKLALIPRASSLTFAIEKYPDR